MLQKLKQLAVVGFVSAAFLATSVAPSAVHAQTTQQELQQRINELLQQLAALQTQLGGGTTPATGYASTAVCTSIRAGNAVFLRDLRIGSTGQDVMELQRFLNAAADTRVAAAGVGSPGLETAYYGPLTANAVSRYQQKYASSILAPLGLTAGTGYFGASTRAQIRQICNATIPTPPTPGDDDDDDDDDLRGGEAFLEDYGRLNTPRNEIVEEGEEEVAVLGVEFDVEEADARLSRVHVNFEAVSDSYEDEPWEFIESVSLWSGDDMIAEIDTDRSGDWNRLSSTFNPTRTRAYQVRFTGLSEVYREGDTAELYVAVNAVRNIDSADIDQTFRVWIPDRGIRMVDAAGINQYTGSDSEYTTFGFEEEGEGEELVVRESSENPRPSILRVNTSGTSDEYAVNVFTIEAEDNDITVNEMQFTLYISDGEEFGNVISDLYIEVGGETYDDYEVTEIDTDANDLTTGNTHVYRVTIDTDEELVIDEGDEVEGSIVLEFQDADNYAAGTMVRASLESTDVDAWDAEGANDLTASDLRGSSIGENHTLLAEGIFAEGVSTNTTRRDTDPQNPGGDVADFVITFDVTAFENDFYIPIGVDEGTTLGTAGVNFVIEDATDNSVAGTSTVALTSNASRQGNFYVVREGQTRRFTLNISFDPASDGFVRAQLYSVNYNESATTVDLNRHFVSPEEDFETALVNLDA